MEQPTPPQAPMSPQEALRRVCFLLERGREQLSRRCVPQGERGHHPHPRGGAARARRSRNLKQIKGIGDSSAAIIGQAVRGVLPAYLASVEEKHGAPLTTAGAEPCRPPR